MESKPEDKPPLPSHVKSRFGWGPVTPSFLQFFNKIQWFVVWMSTFYLLEEFSHSLVNIAITTLERRYGLTSSQTGFMVTAHHIGGLVVVVGVSYLGAKGHKPRWLAIGTFVVGIGCFLFLLPQLISDVYDYSDTSERNSTIGHICETRRPEPISSPQQFGTAEPSEPAVGSHTALYFVIFVLAEFILGVGDTPATTLAAPYIDENVTNPGQTSFYLGIYFAVGAVGAAIGYVTGGQSLTLYVDFNRIDMSNVTVTEGDAYWVGAWWIGFVALAIAFPVVSVLIGGYPKKVPLAPPPKENPDIKVKHKDGKEQKKEDSDTQSENNSSVTRQLLSRLGDMFGSILVLFKNPTYVLLVLGGCAQALIAIGMLPFQAKILQEKFNISPTQAGLILSVISVVGQGGGEIIGGLIMKFWRLGPKGMLRFMAIFAAIAAGFSACFFISCQDIRIAGVNAKYGVAEHLPPTDGLLDPCNAQCACDEQFYQPVCGADNVMYITPCHAGCTEEINNDGELSYSNCECIRNTLLDMDAGELNATAESGRCLQECDSALYSFSALLLLQFLTLFATVPAASVLPLRCVREEYGSLAVGVQWTFLRLLGVLPGPVMAGVVIDSACDFWGSEGSCLLYDKAALSWRIFLCWEVFQAFVVTIWAIAAQVYRPKWSGQDVADMELEVSPGSEVNTETTVTACNSESDLRESDISLNNIGREVTF